MRENVMRTIRNVQLRDEALENLEYLADRCDKYEEVVALEGRENESRKWAAAARIIRSSVSKMRSRL